MLRFLYTIIAVFTIFAQSVFAQNAPSTLNNAANKAAVSIKYFDKKVYYPGNDPENPLYVHVSIKNHGQETLRFKLADDRVFSMDFDARTVRNSELPKTDSIIKKRTTNQTVYFREIALEIGEEYSFVENVRDYISISDPSVYYLELHFYPELYKTNSVPISSNRLTLEIRPAPSVAASSIVPVYSTPPTILQPESIAPDQVIRQTIIARQRNLWDQYFLYMDIEQMVQRDPVRNRKYRASSAIERDRMLANYKLDLMQKNIDRDIVAIPEKFSIERTLYEQDRGTVSVIEWFQYDTFREKKRYTYYIHQRDGIWQIYDYSVENLGTE